MSKLSSGDMIRNISASAEDFGFRPHFVLVKSDSKKPLKKDWKKVAAPLQDVIEHVKADGNVGHVVPKGYVVLDIEPDGVGTFKKLVNSLGLSAKDMPSRVKTANGGYHLYFTLPEGVSVGRLGQRPEGYEGFELLKEGHKAMLPPSKIGDKRYSLTSRAEGGEVFFDCPELPNELLALFIKSDDPVDDLFFDDEDTPPLSFETDQDEESHKPWEQVDISDADTTLLDAIPNPEVQHFTVEGIRRMLDNLDPDMPYEDWIKVGMALYDWHPEQGFSLWKDWSSKGEKYEGVAALEKQWNYFHTSLAKEGRAVTLATVVRMSQIARAQESLKYAKAILKKVADARDPSVIERDVIQALRKLTPKITPEDADMILAALVDRVAELKKSETGVELPKSTRKSLEQRYRAEAFDFGEHAAKGDMSGVPEWLLEWAYLDPDRKFANFKTGEALTPEGFAMKYTSKLKADLERAGITTKNLNISNYLRMKGVVGTASASMFLPQYPSGLIEVKGVAGDVFNMFHHDSLPMMLDKNDPKVKQFGEMFERHIKMMIAQEKYAEILIQWFAHLFQHKGKLIGWAPLIISPDGIGKTMLGELVKVGFNGRYVRAVGPQDVASRFNGWAKGNLLVMLEELRLDHHDNGLKIVNALKPLLTNHMVSIDEKNVRSHSVMNVTNYIAFTNENLPFPISETDRRWFVLRVPYVDRKDFLESNGLDASYYDPFYEVINNMDKWSEAVYTYFMSREISDEFYNMKVAPETESKREMVETTMEITPALSVREAITTATTYRLWFANEDVIVSDFMYDYLQSKGVGITKKSVGRHIASAGYQRFKRVMVNGKFYTIFVSLKRVREMSTSEIEEQLVEHAKTLIRTHDEDPFALEDSFNHNDKEN